MANTEPLVRNYLKKWRKFRGMTQEKLAELADLTAASISQLESGSQWFSAESMASLSEALKCSPADLLAYDPTKPESFWPLFQAAERLQGMERMRARAIISAAIDPKPGGSE